MQVHKRHSGLQGTQQISKLLKQNENTYRLRVGILGTHFAGLISMLERGGNGSVLLAFMLAGWYFYMPFEAYHTAQKRQNGESVDEMTGLLNLPPGVKKLPIGPFVLIGLGLLFLLDNLGLLRINDLMRYWPVLMIIAGVVLLVNRLKAGEESNAE